MWIFLNPILLWAMAAAIIPLVLHLLQRRRIIVMPFSTVRFLKIAQKRSSNRIRLENFLLWLLRTLMMLLIALAFALPVLRITSFKQLMGTARRDVAIVIDASYSMDYTSGRKRVWESAKEAALTVIENLAGGDRVCVFLADDDVTPLIEQPTTDLEMALSQIKAQIPRRTSSQLSRAVLAACGALKESGRREKEIYVVTDGQRLPWVEFGGASAPEQTETSAAGEKSKKAEAPSKAEKSRKDAKAGSQKPAAPEAPDMLRWNPAAIDKEIAFFTAVVGVTAPENSAPLGVEVQPVLLMDDSAGKLLVRLGHTGPAQNISVSLYVDEQEINRQSAVLESATGAEEVFALPSLAVGTHPARVEISADGLPIDNTLFLLLRVKHKLPVLCLGTEADAFYLTRALNPGGDISAIESRRSDPDAPLEVNLADFSCVFLCNAVPLPGPTIMALEQFVQRGGLLVVFPGDRAAPTDYESLACLPAQPRLIEDLPANAQRRTLRLVKSGDPLFLGMKLPPGALPVVMINRQLSWNKLTGESEPVIMAGSEIPFMLRRKFGKGRVLMFAVSADRRWSNLPLSPFFLPIAHQMAQYGASMERGKLFLWACRNLNLNEIVSQIPENVELLGPANLPVEIHKIKSGNEIVMTVESVDEPGIYRLRLPDGGAPEPVLAINVDRTESDLSRVDLPDIPKIFGLKKVNVAENKEDLARIIKEHRVGRPLGEMLLWTVFIIGLLEFLLANRASRKTGTLTEQLTIESSGRVKGKAG